MKPLVTVLIALLAVPQTWALESSADITSLDDSKFATYLQNAQTQCDNSALFAGWLDKNPLRSKANPYADIMKSAELRDAYAKYMTEIKADPSCLSETPTGLLPLDLAKCAYRETQNTLFACYSVASRLKIANTLLPYFNANGKAKDALQKKIDAMKKLAVGDSTSEAVCNTINGGDEISMKQDLLKNSTVQMCRYSYYLKYLDTNATNNVKAFISEETPEGRQYTVGNTEAAAKVLGGIRGKIATENARTRDIHRTATEAFMEMERTYGAHLMLTLIYDDFVEIRDRLKALFNPIGQFIYKASNAQSPYNK